VPQDYSEGQLENWDLVGWPELLKNKRERNGLSGNERNEE